MPVLGQFLGPALESVSMCKGGVGSVPCAPHGLLVHVGTRCDCQYWLWHYLLWWYKRHPGHSYEAKLQDGRHILHEHQCRYQLVHQACELLAVYTSTGCIAWSCSLASKHSTVSTQDSTKQRQPKAFDALRTRTGNIRCQQTPVARYWGGPLQGH